MLRFTAIRNLWTPFNEMKKFIITLYFVVKRYLPYLFREIIVRLRYRNSIPVCGCFDTSWGCWHIFNWGDDLNLHLTRELFHQEIIDYNASLISWLMHSTNYMFVGSVMHTANRNTIVWGSGLLSETYLPKYAPKKILAVRGPLTRQQLIKHGIECPEVYGDPALLLPLFYHPSKEKKHRVGVIPHIYDEDNSMVTAFCQQEGVTLISMKNYGDWHSVIDKIAECDMILSSSLHGIIISDAYAIPNVWVEFSNKVIGNGFKFRDYYLSVNKKIKEPIRIHSITDFNHAVLTKKSWEKPNIELTSLLANCPFNIKLKNNGKEII